MAKKMFNESETQNSLRYEVSLSQWRVEPFKKQVKIVKVYMVKFNIAIFNRLKTTSILINLLRKFSLF